MWKTTDNRQQITEDRTLCSVFRILCSVFCVLYSLFNTIAIAQEESINVTATVDKTEVNIGDKLRYTIKVDYASGVTVTFPDFGEHLVRHGESAFGMTGFTIKDSGTGKPKNMRNSRIVQEQWYILDTYTTGSYTIPSATIKYTEPGGEEREVKTPELHIEVKSVMKEGEDASNIKDIKPPVNIPVSYRKLYLWGGIPFGILVCGGAASWLLLKRKRNGISSVLIKRSPGEIAYDALDALSKSDLITKGQVKEYYFSLSNIVRHYIENRFQLMAPERTTEEFLVEMSNADSRGGVTTPLQDKHKQLIKSFLRHCDLVKFARYNPDGQEIKDAFNSALRLVDETKDIELSPLNPLLAKEGIKGRSVTK
ncbi:MAG TPA: BatD family protein [Candidatus Brocadiales bacterium]|nr:BatD family protein [Candidatus Brocadiales bacterium]